MNEAIELAIEKGGYDRIRYTTELRPLLDPLFWQALGKALGWNPYPFNVPDISGNTAWEMKWHEFIHHLAEGKNPDDFFNELLKS